MSEPRAKSTAAREWAFVLATVAWIALVAWLLHATRRGSTDLDTPVSMPVVEPGEPEELPPPSEAR